MASNAFSKVAANTRASKNLDTVLVGNSSNYLGEGTHDVTIKAVGPATTRDGDVVDNVAVVTFVDDAGKEHNERIYLTNKEGTELGYGLRMLLSGVIPDTDSLEKFMDVAGAEGEKALEMFTGMKTRITLKPGPGFQARSTGNGKFAAFEIKKDGSVGEKITEEYDEIAEARDAAKAAGWFRSYLQARGYEAVAAEDNKSIFATAFVNRGKAKAAKVTKVV